MLFTHEWAHKYRIGLTHLEQTSDYLRKARSIFLKAGKKGLVRDHTSKADSAFHTCDRVLHNTRDFYTHHSRVIKLCRIIIVICEL